MKPDKREISPFAALSYQEQQDKWREWRSRELDYRQVTLPERETAKEKEAGSMPSSLPVKPAPTRHRELDRVLSRHLSAVKKAGAYQFTSINNPPREE